MMRRVATWGSQATTLVSRSSTSNTRTPSLLSHSSTLTPESPRPEPSPQILDRRKTNRKSTFEATLNLPFSPTLSKTSPKVTQKRTLREHASRFKTYLKDGPRRSRNPEVVEASPPPGRKPQHVVCFKEDKIREVMEFVSANRAELRPRLNKSIDWRKDRKDVIRLFVYACKEIVCPTLCYLV